MCQAYGESEIVACSKCGEEKSRFHKCGGAMTTRPDQAETLEQQAEKWLEANSHDNPLVACWSGEKFSPNVSDVMAAFARSVLEEAHDSGFLQHKIGCDKKFRSYCKCCKCTCGLKELMEGMEG